jgi:hypothetical protein
MINPDLLEKIHQYLEKQITIGELEEWLVPREPLLLRQLESDDSDIIGAIELGFAEMSSGYQTEDELRNTLREAIQEKTTSIWAVEGPVKVQIVTGTASVNIDNVFASNFDFFITPQPA